MNRQPCRILLIIGLLILPLCVSGASQAPSGGLRIVSPLDGDVVEPGERFTVIVEPEPGVNPVAVALNSPGLFAVRERPPFGFSVSYPVEAALGPRTLFADGVDARERQLSGQVDLLVETATPVSSIRVEPSRLFFATEREIMVFGVFTDGVTREITRSSETRYVSNNPQIATVASNGVTEGVSSGATTITVTYKDKSVTVPVKVELKKLSATIDVRPESPRNVVNLTAKGRLPVAIFSTHNFNATKVRPETVRFGPGRAKPVLGGGDNGDRDEDERARRQGMVGHIEDIDGDGLPDLLLHFRIRETGLTCADTQAALTGFTIRGERASGSDAVAPIGPSC